MNRKREAVFMGLGILAGLALSGPATQAADYLTARPSSQTFYINGQQTALTAYSIGGNNYVRLRDIGRAVDLFRVMLCIRLPPVKMRKGNPAALRYPGGYGFPFPCIYRLFFICRSCPVDNLCSICIYIFRINQCLRSCNCTWKFLSSQRAERTFYRYLRHIEWEGIYRCI